MDHRNQGEDIPDAGGGALHGLTHDDAGFADVHLGGEGVAGGSESLSSEGGGSASGDGGHGFDLQKLWEMEEKC